jgi:hypothetical protein
MNFSIQDHGQKNPLTLFGPGEHAHAWHHAEILHSKPGSIALEAFLDKKMLVVL